MTGQDRDLIVVVAALRSGGVTLSAKRDVLECIGMKAADEEEKV